jgi:sugar lactone lactonase YvrE
VTSVAEDPEGRFYVLNFGDKRILVFDSAGTHLRTIGREGRGPGEFAAPRTLAVAGSDGLFVVDLLLGRVDRFRRSDGRFLASTLVDAGRMTPMDMRVSPSGAVAVELRSGPSIARGGGNKPPVLARLDTLTGKVTPLAELDTVARREVVTETGEKRRRVQVMDLPFSPRPVWALDARGDAVFGNGAEFAVYRSAGAGRQLLFREERQAPPVTERDKERFFDNPHQKAFRGNIDFPRTKAFYSGLFVDADERVWLRVPTQAEGESWEVRERAGRKLGEVTLPARSRLVGVSSRALYVIQVDEDDVETLHRYRVVR